MSGPGQAVPVHESVGSVNVLSVAGTSLPRTGARGTGHWLGLGAMLILVGAALWFGGVEYERMVAGPVGPAALRRRRH